MSIMQMLLAGAGNTATSTWIASTSHASSGITAFTYTAHNLGTASADRIVVVGVVGRHSGASGALSSGTINGVAATVVGATKNSTSGNTSSIAWLVAAVPTGATGDIVLNFSVNCNNPVVSVFTVTGQASPSATPSANASGVTNASPLNTTITVPARGACMAIGYNGAGGGTVTAFSGGLSLDNNTSFLGSGHANFSTLQSGITVGATFSAGASDTVAASIAYGP